MLRKIYQELVLIRKELQAIRKSEELKQKSEVTLYRAPYSNSYCLIPKQRCKDL